MTISFRPRGDQEERLERLAQRTGRSKSFYLSEAVDLHLEELETQYWAHEVIERWEASDRSTRPLSELTAELGL